VALREDARQAAAALIASPKLVVDAANASGETALMMASLRGHRAAAQQLVARGAALNRAGWTPLHYAASGPDPQLVAWLLEQGAAIDAPSPNRTTALMMAARYGSPDTAELLLARGADPKLRNERELSAADFARAAGREALAARLEAASLR
jgi:ankyrin repeat protein